MYNYCSNLGAPRTLGPHFGARCKTLTYLKTGHQLVLGAPNTLPHHFQPTRHQVGASLQYFEDPNLLSWTRVVPCPFNIWVPLLGPPGPKVGPLLGAPVPIEDHKNKSFFCYHGSAWVLEGPRNKAFDLHLDHPHSPLQHLPYFHLQILH